MCVSVELSVGCTVHLYNIYYGGIVLWFYFCFVSVLVRLFIPHGSISAVIASSGTSFIRINSGKKNHLHVRVPSSKLRVVW